MQQLPPVPAKFAITHQDSVAPRFTRSCADAGGPSTLTRETHLHHFACGDGREIFGVLVVVALLLGLLASKSSGCLCCWYCGAN